MPVADEAALKDLTSNLGLDCNFTREGSVSAKQIYSRGFRVVEERGNVHSGVETEEMGGEGEVEDVSDERFPKMHRKGEIWEKKVDRKQQQSARWQLRKEREMGKKKGNQQQQQKPAGTPRIRLGPEPEAATHIYVKEDENAPVTIFGRVLPAMPDAKPFELPWLGNSVRSSVESKKQLKMGGRLKNKEREARGTNAKVQETGTIEDKVGGAIDQKNNDEVNIEGATPIRRIIHFRETEEGKKVQMWCSQRQVEVAKKLVILHQRRVSRQEDQEWRRGKT